VTFLVTAGDLCPPSEGLSLYTCGGTEGTVSNGGDVYGIFGSGKDLGGQPFKLIVTFYGAHP
jgi:hypothetical protein